MSCRPTPRAGRAGRCSRGAPVNEASALVDALAPRLLAGVGAALRNQQQQYSCRPQDLACLAETLCVVGFTPQRLGLTHALDAALSAITTPWSDEDLVRLGLARAAARQRGLPFSEHGDPPCSNEAKPFNLHVKAAPGLTIDVGDAKNKSGFDCFKFDDRVYDSNDMHLRDAGPVAVRARLLQGLGWRVRRILPARIREIGAAAAAAHRDTSSRGAAGLPGEFNPAAFLPRPPIGAAGLAPSGEFNPAAVPRPGQGPAAPPARRPIAATVAPHRA